MPRAKAPMPSTRARASALLAAALGFGAPTCTTSPDLLPCDPAARKLALCRLLPPAIERVAVYDCRSEPCKALLNTLSALPMASRWGDADTVFASASAAPNADGAEATVCLWSLSPAASHAAGDDDLPPVGEVLRVEDDAALPLWACRLSATLVLASDDRTLLDACIERAHANESHLTLAAAALGTDWCSEFVVVARMTEEHGPAGWQLATNPDARVTAYGVELAGTNVLRLRVAGQPTQQVGEVLGRMSALTDVGSAEYRLGDGVHTTEVAVTDPETARFVLAFWATSARVVLK